MARVRRDANLGSKDARAKLPARPEPYFRVLERGLSIGYRRTPEGGAWVVRRYDERTKRHSEQRLASADDHRDADGVEVLDFGQAQRKALSEAKRQAEAASGKHYTVADAVAHYLEHLRAERKTADDAEAKLNAYVVAKLGKLRIADLKPGDFDDWKAWALKRQKTRVHKPTKKQADATSKTKPTPAEIAEKQRRRKATINRVIASLIACLNYAHARKRVATRDAWSGLKKYRAVDSARLRWLTVDETTRLLNASPKDLRALIHAALHTGCREGELLATQVRDLDTQSKTLLVPDSKSGKPRRIPLNDEGVEFFEAQCAGRREDALLFTRGDGTAWYRVAILRAVAEACKQGNVAQPVTFYTLRHTYASHLVQGGTPLLYVASALGHRDARMVEKHYAHLAPDHVADTIRANLPSFGIAQSSNVTAIRKPKKRSR